MNRRRALVFAGAGASYAVDKEAYPTTVQFFSKLPEKIRDHALIQAIVAHLPEKFGDGAPDVEKILWCLEELEEYLWAVDKPKHPASWFLPNNMLPSLVRSKHEVSSYVVVAREGQKVTTELRDKIAARVYEFYSGVPDQKSVAKNWQALFEFLAKKSYWPDVVTTNYDLVIEQASEYAEQPIDYGKGRGVVSALDLQVWKRQLAEADYVPVSNGLLTKLHGSVNWLREHGKIVFGGTEFKGNHAYHGVIYPGFKGVPKEEPFSLMHSYLEAAIQRADLLIFIGFAFRDEYINTCIERNLGTKVIHVVDPGDVIFPAAFAGNIRHIKRGFDLEAIQDIAALA